jgi:flagellar biosynthesis protein FlhF
MRLETFRGRDLSTVCAQARATLGDDALIVHTRTLNDGGRPWIEVEATAASDVARLERLMTATPASLVARGGRATRRPRVIALVGPTGAGKTTTLAKLATSSQAFGSLRAGFLTLDTHRAAAFEQLEAYAEAADLPCELVYEGAELVRAMKRLAECDVILVDTPGRGPKSDNMPGGWRQLLRTVNPDETHLVVPATTRFDLIPRMRLEYSPMALTHGLLTKLDEVPADSKIAACVSALSLPMRWITDGQEVPHDLHAAGPSVLGPLGMSRMTLGAS